MKLIKFSVFCFLTILFMFFVVQCAINFINMPDTTLNIMGLVVLFLTLLVPYSAYQMFKDWL